MTLLAALTLGGARGADALADRWQEGAAAAVTVQIPEGDPERMERALTALRAMPEVAEARAMDRARLDALLRPWLGEAPAIPVPGVIELRLSDISADPVLLGDRLARAVPGAAVEAHGLWVQRLAMLARSLQAVALSVLALVAAVSAAVVAVATRAGLAARRDAIEVLHALGATDSDIAGRFARRLGTLAAAGALLGTAVSLPVLGLLAELSAPWTGTGGASGNWLGAMAEAAERLPWGDLLALPPLSFLVGWATAQATVRAWLRRLP
jgi:cell division transport system permease protein